MQAQLQNITRRADRSKKLPIFWHLGPEDKIFGRGRGFITAAREHLQDGWQVMVVGSSIFDSLRVIRLARVNKNEAREGDNLNKEIFYFNTGHLLL